MDVDRAFHHKWFRTESCNTYAQGSKGSHLDTEENKEHLFIYVVCAALLLNIVNYFFNSTKGNKENLENVSS